MRHHRKLVLGASLLAFAVLTAACGNDSGGGGTPTTTADIERGTVVVGVSFAGPESQLVAEMYAQVLENAGYTVERQLNLDSRAAGDEALQAENGGIDVKPEYLAFELTALDEDADNLGTADEVYPRVQEAAEAKGLVALEFSPANSTNVFVMLPDRATELGVATMSDLGPVSGDLVLGAPPDCDANYPCEEGLKEVYGIEFKEIKKLDFGGPDTIAAIDSGAVDVGELFSLDVKIPAKGYTVLEDDESLQPAGNFFALAREDILNGEVEELLNSVTTSLTTEEMLELVSRVQVDQEDVADVATDYLTGKGLLG